MSLRSSAAGSQAVDADRGQPGIRGRLAERGERVVRLAGRAPSVPVAAGAGTRSSPDGAAAGERLDEVDELGRRRGDDRERAAGTITRSLGSRTSSAGTRARSTRTQPTPRASSPSAPARRSESASGRSVARISWSGAIAGKCAVRGARPCPRLGAAGRPVPAGATRRAATRSSSRRAELARRSRRSGPRGPRARAGRRAPSRAQTRRRGSQNVISSPTISEPERDPHEALPRVALRDQQREVLEPAQLDREVRALRRVATRPGSARSARGRRSSGEPSAFVPDARGTGARAARPCRRPARWSSSWSATSRPGHGELGEREAGRLVGHRDRARTRAACRPRRGSRRPAPARSRSGGTCSRRRSSGSLTRIVLSATCLPSW